MGMRVIAGKYRHRLLKYPENCPDIRPTKDRIREAFFSAMGDISDKVFLDLYAGSGSMGIEAISRGAKKAYFVDESKEAIVFVKENIKSLNIENAEIIFSKDIDALQSFESKGIKFDLVYLDPPYESDLYDSSLSFIYNNDLLNKGAIVALETKRAININPLWYKTIKEYHYGEISVIVLRN